MVNKRLFDAETVRSFSKMTILTEPGVFGSLHRESGPCPASGQTYSPIDRRTDGRRESEEAGHDIGGGGEESRKEGQKDSVGIGREDRRVGGGRKFIVRNGNSSACLR